MAEDQEEYSLRMKYKKLLKEARPDYNDEKAELLSRFSRDRSKYGVHYTATIENEVDEADYLVGNKLTAEDHTPLFNKITEQPIINNNSEKKSKGVKKSGPRKKAV
jgi:hypothetical protein